MSFSEWREYSIDDIAISYDKKRIPLSSRQRELKKGVYPYYGASGIIDYIDDFLFDGEFVLISEDGENLKTRQTPIAFKVNGQFWVNNHAHIYKGIEPFLNDWIVYYFKKLDVFPYITGAVQPKLNQENLKLIKIKIPDFSEAKKIVSILSTLDEKIELNRQTNTTLEAIAQAIFKEWFVDFNFPGATGEMVESELGLIPKGWRVGRLGELIEISNETVKPMNSPELLFSHYSIPSYDDGLNPIIEAGSAILSNKYLVKEKSILVSKLNPRIPRIWAINQVENENSICSTEFQVFLPIKHFYYSFSYFYLIQQSTIDTMVSKATGTSSSHQRINPNDILGLDVIIPNDELIIDFENNIREYFKYLEHNLNENLLLAKTRDSLLPKLMIGEIEL